MNTWINLVEWREALKTWLSFCLDLIKLSTLFSGPLGLFLLVAYLGSVGSPMLTPDSSTVLTLLLVVAGYMFAMFFLCIFAYAPVYTYRVNRKTRRLIKTGGGSTFAPYTGKLFKGFNGALTRKSSKNEFVVFHGSSLLLFVSLALGSLLEFSIASWLVSLLLFTAVGTVLSLIKYKHYRVIPRHRSAYLSEKFQQLAAFRIVQGGISRAFMTLVWVLAIFQVADSVRSQIPQLSYLSSTSLSFWFLVFMLSLYFLLTHVRVVITRVPFAFLFLALMFVIYTPGYAGGLALRVLGIGGGIPISVTIKTMELETKEIVAKTKTGCLIIKSGSEMVIRTTSGTIPKSCDSSILKVFSADNSSRTQMFSQVEVFPTSQIIQFNKLDADKP